MVEGLASDGSKPAELSDLDLVDKAATLDIPALLAKLQREIQNVPEPVLAFDGDGTLWSGDVGEDVFRRATRLGLLRAESQPNLLNEARRYGIATHGETDPNRVAQQLFAAYLGGDYPEREACAMMTWCYAGLDLTVLTTFIRETFEEAKLTERLHAELTPVFELVRSQRLTTLVVSASPQRIVEEAAALWGIAAENVMASRPALLPGHVVAPQLAEPVPYAEHKPWALAQRVDLSRLVASFGDNVFDIELLGAARFGVAVRPKPALRTRLPELANVFLLQAAHP